MPEPTSTLTLAAPPSTTQAFRRTLTRAVVFPVVLLIILIGIFLWQLGSMLNTNQQVQHNNMVIGQTTVVLKLLVDMESGLRGYLLTGDTLFLAPFNDAQAVFADNFHRLQNLVSDDPTQTANLKTLQSGIDTWMKFATDALTAVADGQSESVTDTDTQLIGKQKMDSIRQQLASFVDTQDQQRASAIDATRNNTQIVILSVIIGGLSIGALVALSTVRQLLYLSRTYEQAQALARQQAEEVLKQQDWLRGTLSSIGDAVIAADMRGSITFINPVTAQLTGWTAAEAAGKPLTDIYNVVLDSGAHPSQTANGSKQLVMRDGKPIPIEDTITLIRDGRDNPIGTVVVFRDITRRKIIERERMGLIETQAHYANQLRQSNEQLQQFAYIASHDLQEPLRMVISYLQLLEQRYGKSLSEDAREFIAYAVDGAARMKELINGLLKYARLDTTEQDERELTSMQTALEKALTNLSIPIGETGAVITHDPMPQLMANPMQMMQLLQNLLGNALKFRTEKPLKIHVGAERKGNEWQFCVRDNGIGIAPEYQKRIFGMFQRLHVNSAYSGTGIGLTICKKVVERHNGRIWVESVLGEGSTFYFALPIEPAPVSRPAAS